MTSSIHHQNRPSCVEPEPVGRYPCHPALAILTVEGMPRVLCDVHAERLLRDHLDDGLITRVEMVDDEGGTRPWETESGTPDLVRAYRFCSRAFVDYGCCLPGQVDPEKVTA